MIPQCSSKILPPGKGFFEETEPFELHVMHKKLEDQGVEKEAIKQVNTCDTFFNNAPTMTNSILIEH